MSGASTLLCSTEPELLSAQLCAAVLGRAFSLGLVHPFFRLIGQGQQRPDSSLRLPAEAGEPLPMSPLGRSDMRAGLGRVDVSVSCLGVYACFHGNTGRPEGIPAALEL